MVEDIRCQLPRIGGRKLQYLLKNQLPELKIGRDKLFDIL